LLICINIQKNVYKYNKTLIKLNNYTVFIQWFQDVVKNVVIGRSRKLNKIEVKKGL